ncbi:MAG: DUF1311 domain-containing protein [Bacteroidetes bacterium]|nr:DUF1311 domain-containing protein [Bacteroidota bacterium]
MRTFLFLTSILCMGLLAQSQEILTPAKLKKIIAEADSEAAAYKKTLKEDDGHSAAWIEFSADTFRINRINDKRMDVDFSTQGMNQTVMATTDAYDLLMNKYYNKLMGLLQPEDKKVLVAAQRAWLVFRDAEKKLIGVTRKEEYSGGGTIQSNIFTGLYASMVEERAIAIFNYYDEIIKE